MKSLVENKRARFDYFILDTYEAGIALSGAEVKSIRESRASLQDSFVRVRNGQAFLVNAFIHPYGYADTRSVDPKRERKLLLHKKEIGQIESKVAGKSITAVPLSFYDKHNNLKLLIGIGKGKKQFDKRAAIKDRELKRNLANEMKKFRT
jgi:SsrA-binding protein